MPFLSIRESRDENLSSEACRFFGKPCSAEVGTIFPLEVDLVTVGRASDNDLCLDSPRVFRHHLQLHRVSNEHFLEYLNTRQIQRFNSGTVSGNMGEWIKLSHGDTFGIGFVTLEFLEQRESDRPLNHLIAR